MWKAQDGKCQLCGEQLQDGQDECDHIVPVVESCRGQQVQLRLLCGVCHASVTDAGQRRSDPLASTFNLHTWSFVTGARPVPATFTANMADARRAPYVLCDLARCRRNIAYQGCSTGWPLICSTDTFVEVTPENWHGFDFFCFVRRSHQKPRGGF